jgi:hypothetical protein
VRPSNIPSSHTAVSRAQARLDPEKRRKGAQGLTVWPLIGKRILLSSNLTDIGCEWKNNVAASVRLGQENQATVEAPVPPFLAAFLSSKTKDTLLGQR